MSDPNIDNGWYIDMSTSGPAIYVGNDNAAGFGVQVEGTSGGYNISSSSSGSAINYYAHNATGATGDFLSFQKGAAFDDVLTVASDGYTHIYDTLFLE